MTMWDNTPWNTPDPIHGLAEISGLNALISDEEKKINNAYYQIGQLYATIHRSDSEEEFTGLVEAVAESEEKIREYRAKILNIRGLVCCPQCGVELPKAAAFCMSCGAPMPKVEEAPPQDNLVQCSGCGAMVLKEMRFCTTCGRTMTAPAEEAAPEQGLSEAAEAPAAEAFVEDIPVKYACPQCGTALENDALFCANCGTSVAAAPAPAESAAWEENVEAPAADAVPEAAPVKLACGNCGAILEKDALFCANCGASAKETAVPAPEEDPEENSIWAKTLENEGLDLLEEEPAEEVPEEPVGFTDGASALLMAVPDLDDDENWGVPTVAPVTEIPEEAASAPEEKDIWDETAAAPALYIVEEEPAVEAPEEPVGFTDGASALLIALPDLDDEENWSVPAAAPVEETLEEAAPVKLACGNCGAALEADMLFCTECGASVKAPVSEEKDTWEEPVGFTDGASALLIAVPDLDDENWGVPAAAPVVKIPEEAAPGKPVCVTCGAELEDDAMFCTECGTPVKAAAAPGKRFCVTCGAELEDGMLFCTECGTRV